MRNLLILKAGENELTSVPLQLAQLSKLIILDLSHNKFEEFPEAICYLPALSKLKLTACGIKHFPVFQFTPTDGRDVSRRFLERYGPLPEVQQKDEAGQIRARSLLPALQHLDLSRNGLGALPRWLTFLPKLRTLDITSNPVEGIPVYEGSWPSLRELRSSLCKFETFGMLQAIEEVKENDYEDPLDFGIVRGLTALQVRLPGAQCSPIGLLTAFPPSFIVLSAPSLATAAHFPLQ